MNEFTYVRKTGNQILEVAHDFALLRIAVFKEFPYLYAGEMAYEMEYIQTYAQSENAFLFAIYKDGKMIGASTCIPLEDETMEVKQPFLDARYPISEIFYFGESMLLPPYRSMGFGHLFFEEREKYARQFSSVRTVCFCAVQRSKNHPLKPAAVFEKDTFWTKKGFVERLELVCEMEWKDLDKEVSDFKQLTFWTKSI
ncbi:MAG: GNAT family N-acetyltransferase [Crocinitomicaceae bacterium]|nr:MAG: GNAT family N-acetyltransferase [Crocinitomicaceae bacterium]